MNGRNLIPEQRLTTKRRQQAIRRWIVIDLSYLVVLVLLGAVYAFCSLQRGEHSAVPLALAQIQTSTATLASLQQKAVSLKAQLRSVNDVYRQPDWSILLRALAQQVGDDIVLSVVDSMGAAAERTSTNSGPPGLQLQGMGRSQQAVTQFVLRLEELQFFSRVKVDQVASRSFRGRDGVGFVITCSVPGSVEGSR